VPGFGADIKLHATGCPNSCRQHWIADVGLRGVMMNRDGEQIEGYDVSVGGALGAHGAVAGRLGHRIPATEAAGALSRLFLEFTRRRAGGEPFSAWANRASDPVLRDILTNAAPQAGAAA
jgi:sulfite reductase (ferredoxin)